MIFAEELFHPAPQGLRTLAPFLSGWLAAAPALAPACLDFGAGCVNVPCFK
jgi:hypothetical protein